MDYPFNLKGILYFPKINTEYDSIEGTIKLYNNQVFIADNIKEVIPEFLMLLKGAIDCPDLPLNVSRSALQNDGFVKKISDYITKKVADKLSGMCKTDRENYEKYWDDISSVHQIRLHQGQQIRQRRWHDYILFKNLDGKYLTIKDLVKEEEAAKADSTETENKTEDTASTEEKKDESSDANKEPEKTTIYYVTDEIQQSQYINMFREAGMDAVILKHNIDNAFISHMEQLHDNIKFQRIDADVTDTFKEETDDGCPQGDDRYLNRCVPQGTGQRQADGQGREAEKCKRFFYDDSFRGESPDAGNDENVRHGRHGSVHVRQRCHTRAQCKQQARYSTLPSTRMMSMFR